MRNQHLFQDRPGPSISSKTAGARKHPKDGDHYTLRAIRIHKHAVRPPKRRPNLPAFYRPSAPWTDFHVRLSLTISSLLPKTQTSTNNITRYCSSVWMIRRDPPTRKQYTTNLLGTTRTRITVYHPTTNGMVERMHLTLKTALRAQPNPQNWVDCLPLVLLGMRAAIKEDIGFICRKKNFLYDINTSFQANIG